MPSSGTTTTGEGRTFVAYLRVSTDKQGRSGLGLEAQQAAINAFLRPEDRLLAPPFVEVESGRNTARPQLAAAIARCRATGATLLVAKLDRLGRNLHFISGLMESGVPFLAADAPDKDRFMLHIRAAFAEEEARKISERTKAALAAAKARGKKLGGDRGYRPASPPDAKAGGKASAAARGQAADRAAFGVAAAIEEARQGGAVSLRQIAAALTERGVSTPSGEGAWTATAVRRVIARAERIAA
jgi:DNA invertase Pin-like site-specific DNA recombinase